ncbi:MAG: hypothetical protein HXX13_13565 [Bacteroidetes bacterium]|nr:hypothetical protein [Bacteroidota bacterium]
MITKIISLIGFCVFLFFQISLAQEKAGVSSVRPTAPSTSGSSASGSETHSGTGLILRNEMLEGSEGNIYLGELWPKGKLILKDGEIKDNYLFRYDVYADQMQFIKGKDTLAFASPAEIKSVTFDGMTFIYAPYECTGMLMKGYFEVLSEGRKQLLLKRTISYHLKADASLPSDQKDTYLINESYFLKEGNMPAQKLLPDRKDVLIALNDRKKEVDSFLRKNSNRLKTKGDLIQLMDYYNSLK